MIAAAPARNVRPQAKVTEIMPFHHAPARNSQMLHAPQENLADCVLQCATDIMHDRKRDLSREDGTFP
jgi:hypothetical protein